MTPSTDAFQQLPWKDFVDSTGMMQQDIREYYLGDGYYLSSDGKQESGDENIKGRTYLRLLTEMVRDALAVGAVSMPKGSLADQASIAMKPDPTFGGKIIVIQLTRNGIVERSGEFRIDEWTLEDYLGAGTRMGALSSFFQLSGFMDAWNELS